MVNPIVQVNVSQNVAAAPSAYQSSGAFISQGGTTQAANSLTLLTQLSDLTAILSTSKAITSMSLSTGTVTVTTTEPHGWTNGDIIPAVIAGVTPSAYNGAFTITITGASTFTYPLAGSPGSVTVQGTVILADEAELLAMGTTFFAQGGGQAVYVLELGEGTVAEGVTALTTWISNNPFTIYSYLVPTEWDGVSQFLTFLAGFESTTSKTYFWITSTTGTYTSYTALQKCAFVFVPAAGAPATEFGCAASFFVTLHYAPGSTNKVTPLAFSYLYGVTPWVTKNNQTILAALLAANVNYIGTGSEAGISTAILRNGHLKDGNPFNYWYSIDWAQINLNRTVANVVINGSNNPLAPLDYNQAGINSLQAACIQVMNNAITYGLALGTVQPTELAASVFAQNFENGAYRGQLAVNAEPFLIYTGENPNDYAIGKYAGLAVTYTPARGFESIIINLNATNFV